MKISISTSDHIFSGYPKQLIVYCDEKVYKTLDLKRNINLNIDDNVKKVRIVCKNYSRKNILAKIIFFSLSALSFLFFLLAGFEFFIFLRVKKAYKFVKSNN